MQGDRDEAEYKGMKFGDPVIVEGIRSGVFTFHSARFKGRKCIWIVVFGGTPNRVRSFRFFDPSAVTKAPNTKRVRQRHADADRQPSVKPPRKKKGGR